MPRQQRPEGTIWVGNGTIRPMRGCCPGCAIFHETERAEELCRRLMAGDGEGMQIRTFQRLADVVRRERWDRADIVRRLSWQEP